MNRKPTTTMWIVVAAVALIAALLAFGELGATARAQEETPEPAPGATRVREADGAVMVYVPAGEFLMGSRMGTASPESAGESPRHIVYLDGYWIDRTEVTNRQFEMFVDATGYRTYAEDRGRSFVVTVQSWDANSYPAMIDGADWRHPEGPESSIAGRENEPMLQTRSTDAQAYCAWAGGRQPTEAEWEKACAGTLGQRYSWGDEPPSCEVTVMRDASGPGCGHGEKALPVGGKPAGASPYGALDMLGNAKELVGDWFSASYYDHSPASNPQGPYTGDDPVVRDSSWIDNSSTFWTCQARWGGGFADNLTGFRCVVPAPAPLPSEVAATPAAPPNSRVLFIGDEDAWFLDRYLPGLAASGTPSVALASQAFALQDYLLSHYSVLSSLVDVGLAVDSGEWDTVILEQDLDRSWRAAKNFCEEAGKWANRATEAGAETILFMPWDNAAKPPPPTLQETADVYTKCGAELGLRVAPVGLAFERAAAERPDLSLYIPDGTHANQYGLYLALNVLYATIFDRTPVGLTYRMDDVAPTTVEYALWDLANQKDWQLTEEQAAFLQRIAWETVQDYQPVARAQEETPTPKPPKPTPGLTLEVQIEQVPCPALAGNLLGDPAERTVHVILPPSYAATDQRYPVLYAIGGGDGEIYYAMGFKEAMHSLYLRGEIREMILVIPDGTNTLGGSQFRSSPVIGDYETCFTRDIVDYIDTHYRTLPSPDSRALSGCCSGGIVAARLGLKYPDVFGVIAATDAGLDESLEAWPQDVDAVKRLWKLPEKISDLRLNNMVAWYIQAAAAVAPDPDNPPFYCQMPIRIVDEHGEFVPEVIAKIVADDAVRRAHRYVQQPSRLRGIFIRKSLFDPDFDLPMSNFVQALNDLGIEHEYEEAQTSHCGYGWEEASLRFIASHLVFEE